ncbi:40S ribosomal protein S8 [Patella vulgata]|uniref:40S ribosomal protein S8 n=1 Tax=Patella vulgata TaxID=6465 RepID=UPI00217FA035|nr:40S ribosomal protein S8 [Patella vulgata]
MGISRDKWHKRLKSGGRRPQPRKKRKHEMGRPPAQTKLGPKRIHLVRTRGGNTKQRALRLENSNVNWSTQGITRKTRILDVVYNASSNELVRTKTLVKSAIIQVDANPFRQWFENHFGLPVIPRKKSTKKAGKKTDEEKAKRAARESVKVKKLSKEVLFKRRQNRKKLFKVEPSLQEQFRNGRLLVKIASRPGNCGRCDGFVLEGKELEFYMKKVKSKKRS